MKKDIFETYLNRVIRIMNIDKDVVFKRTKKRESTESRQILYWVCDQRPIQHIYIQKYMQEYGYNTELSEINYAINAVNKKIEEDADYSIILNKII